MAVHFLSKLSDCDGENSETDSSVDFAQDCGYISASNTNISPLSVLRLVECLAV